MHQNHLKPEMFEVRMNGEHAGLDTIFPDWNPHDRFGIVIHEPWGGIGASLLLQAAMAEFYRVRQAAGIKDIYAEVYAFNVGRDFGDLSMYDIWPFYKEVVVESNPAKVLQAINAHGITRLAVPAGPLKKFDFFWPEEIAFEDRIRTVIAYSADGRTPDADIEIRGVGDMPEENTKATLNIEPIIKQYQDTDLVDARRWLGHVVTRLSATTPDERQRANDLHNANIQDGVCVERFLRADQKYAMARLVP
jgi:hypothetical protein